MLKAALDERSDADEHRLRRRTGRILAAGPTPATRLLQTATTGPGEQGAALALGCEQVIVRCLHLDEAAGGRWAIRTSLDPEEEARPDARLSGACRVSAVDSGDLG